MATVRVTTWIPAPPERCFDIARSVEAHVVSTVQTGEVVVGGVRTGLLVEGDEVEFEGTHLGVRQRLRAKIMALDRPRSFRDSQVRGAFSWFNHDHLFRPVDGGTEMEDVFVFEAPLGPLGRWVARWVLVPHLERVLRLRAATLKELAEGEGWRTFVPG